MSEVFTEDQKSHLRQKDSDPALPRWDNGYLSTFEHLLIGSSELSFHEPNYKRMLLEGEDIPDINTVRRVLDSSSDSATAAKVRGKKKFLPVLLFGMSGMQLDAQGITTAVRLPEPDDKGDVSPSWQVVLLDEEGLEVNDVDKLGSLSLAPVASKFLGLSHGEQGLVLEYSRKK